MSEKSEDILRTPPMSANGGDTPPPPDNADNTRQRDASPSPSFPPPPRNEGNIIDKGP